MSNCCCSVPSGKSRRPRGIASKGRCQIQTLLFLSVLFISIVTLYMISKNVPRIVASPEDAGTVPISSSPLTKGVMTFSILRGGKFCAREQNFLRSISANQCEVFFYCLHQPPYHTISTQHLIFFLISIFPRLDLSQWLSMPMLRSTVTRGGIYFEIPN